MRSSITAQLNKGETLHALRRHLVIGSRAQLPADEDDHHRRHALCLQLLVNAALVWNTRYTAAALDQLAATHPELVADDSALARLAPVGHAHINPLGRYRFDNPDSPPPGQLRALRDPAADDLHGAPTSPIAVSGDKHQALEIARMMSGPRADAALSAVGTLPLAALGAREPHGERLADLTGGHVLVRGEPAQERVQRGAVLLDGRARQAAGDQVRARGSGRRWRRSGRPGWAGGPASA